jgi:predicted metalloprotease
MGDGILEAYSALGFEDVAPQAILAHEFGHHIQFQLGLFPAVRTPEGTRRTELMADAYSAYYLSHSRGATMQWKRVQKFLEVFFNIGDCGFASNGHHGTPLQRMAAAEWGYEVANSAKKQGKILTSEEFTILFEAKLPEFVAVPLTVQ